MSGDACVNCIVDQEPALGMPPSPCQGCGQTIYTCTRPPNLCWGCVARALDEVPTLSAEDETIIRSFEVGQLPNNFAYPL
jgi:hypothetical protein